MVYTLSDFDGNVFYVGCTQSSLSDRLKQHLWEVNWKGGNRAKKEKIKSLNNQIIITPLEDADTERKWIKWYMENGIELTNMGRELLVYELTYEERFRLEYKIYDEVGGLVKFLKIFNLKHGMIDRALRWGKHTISKEERDLLREFLEIEIRPLEQIIHD